MATTGFNSDLTCAGFQATSTATLAGANATSLVLGADNAATVTHIISSLKSISFGAVAAGDSVSTTVTLAGVVPNATVIVNPTSKWSGAYYDITISAVASAASTVLVSAVNSTITSVTPDAMNFRVTAFNF